MPFRSDINGLRAIAVIFVVCFHFFPQFIPGGFIGVDIFFVISGYLMTKIILSNISTSNFSYFSSITDFILARIKRIVPALAWLCFLLLALGYWQFSQPLLNEFSKHALSSMLFFSNFTYWFETGYFDAAAKDKWLLHTWSLSVEWQFYILYPLVLMSFAALLKVKWLKVKWLKVKWLKVKWLKRLILVATIFSFVLGVYFSGYFQSQINPAFTSASYYLLPTRAWEMLIGGVAFCYGMGNIALSTKSRKILTHVALIVMLGCCFLVSEHTPWPGIWALIPTLCTYVVIACNSSHSPILDAKPMQQIGGWSYSIYLWHWPIMVAGNYFKLSLWGPLFWPLAGLILAVLFGYLSYRFIEMPNRPKLNLAIFIAVLALSSWPLYNKYQQSSKNQVARLAYSSDICQGFEAFCHSYATNPNQPLDFIIWGDSHSKSLARALALEGYHLTVFTTLGCPPIDGIRRLDQTRGDSGCDSQTNDRIYQHLLSTDVREQTNQLILIGRWSVYHWGWHKNGQLQQANHYLCYQHCDDHSNTINSQNARSVSLNYWQQGLEHTIKGLSEHYQLTLFKGGPSLKVRGIDYRNEPWQQLTLNEHLAYQKPTDEIIAKLSDKYQFNTIEHGRMWFKDEKLQMYHQQHLLFNDDNHPTLQAWQLIMKPLTTKLPQPKRSHD